MKNVVIKENNDKVLETIITIIEYVTLVIIVYMLVKRKPLVWHVIDTVITFCFMIYLNFELPFNCVKLFTFFNLKRFNILPSMIESWVSPI